MSSYQAQQAADLVDGAEAADETQQHGEGSDSDQDVAGDLDGGGVA